jgi:hypothetical protein
MHLHYQQPVDPTPRWADCLTEILTLSDPEKIFPIGKARNTG